MKIAAANLRRATEAESAQKAAEDQATALQAELTAARSRRLSATASSSAMRSGALGTRATDKATQAPPSEEEGVEGGVPSNGSVVGSTSPTSTSHPEAPRGARVSSASPVPVPVPVPAPGAAHTPSSAHVSTLSTGCVVDGVAGVTMTFASPSAGVGCGPDASPVSVTATGQAVDGSAPECTTFMGAGGLEGFEFEGGVVGSTAYDDADDNAVQSMVEGLINADDVERDLSMEGRGGDDSGDDSSLGDIADLPIDMPGCASPGTGPAGAGSDPSPVCDGTDVSG